MSDLSGYHLSEYDGSSAAAATGNGVDHGSALYHNPYYQGPFNYYTHRQGVAQNLATLGNAILLGTLASGALAVGEAFLYSTASTNSASVTTNSANAATNLATVGEGEISVPIFHKLSITSVHRSLTLSH